MWTFERSTGLLALRALGLLLCSAATLLLAQRFLLLAPLEAPTSGARGRSRQQARKNAVFAQLEPILSRLAALLSCLPCASLREAFTRLAFLAGDPAGLFADEWLAVSALACVVGGLVAHQLISAAGMHWAYALYAGAAALLIPYARLHGIVALRVRELERGLPLCMDLCVLCMSAGADFSAALAFVVSEARGINSVCQDELARVLDELKLGRTRSEALRAMGARTTSAAVHELVAAVCQAELKGSPLQATLSIQASGLRQRRSVRAEELAARAGVKMLLPMLLLVACLLLLIFGPFIVQGAGL
jgi:tight adherence protein C